MEDWATTDKRQEVGVVRGEPVTIIGPKPLDWFGLGYRNGDILVQYPDGEVGAVSKADIAPLTE
jgi:hypothetical protein